ncbi:MAG: nucleoside deaminase [Actinobacteria bacterium]|nr:nucleoside deaminase [Actinomycetota bacterium]
MRREPDHPAVVSAAPGPSAFEDRWAELEPEFRHCLELAWKSAQSGSLGIGSVITGAGGAVVATGRNRLFEQHCGDDQLAGSPVAHAEMNALGKLKSGRSHRDFTLWTSLEPCLLCAGGIRLAQIGTVRFLAEDPLWSGLSGLPALDPFIGAGWPRITGPADGEFAAFALLLPLHTSRFWTPGSEIELAWRAHAPALGELATELVASHELVALAANGTPVEEVLGELWERLQLSCGR